MKEALAATVSIYCELWVFVGFTSPRFLQTARSAWLPKPHFHESGPRPLQVTTANENIGGPIPSGPRSLTKPQSMPSVNSAKKRLPLSGQPIKRELFPGDSLTTSVETCQQEVMMACYEYLLETQKKGLPIEAVEFPSSGVLNL